jgi:hypothetical protein
MCGGGVMCPVEFRAPNWQPSTHPACFSNGGDEIVSPRSHA